jgi:hypothetical protein
VQGIKRAPLEQNAVKASTQFLSKFAGSIVAVLGCFDRLIFKGYLPFGGDGYLNHYADRTLGIRRKDFLPQVQQFSQQLVEHAQRAAQQAKAPYLYLQGKHDKQKLVQRIARERRHGEGLLAVLCCQETCRTVKLRYAQGKPRLEFARRPQRVLYYYFFDAEFGLMHVRIQTWFPFTIQVYVNGHQWLAQEMLRKRLGFVQRDNAFTQLDDPQQAQRLSDRLVYLAWQRRLNQWARRANPLLRHPWLRGMEYRWVIDQAEYSTDVLFRSRQSLAELYPRLLDHAVVTFSAQDILTFLGRRLHPRFEGEVVTECKKDRWPGARIKHRVKANWLKMYDKFGQVLRVETVINQPREFRVRRARRRGGKRRMVWCPMNKGIVNRYQYQAVAQAANLRYLEALSAVADPTQSYQQVERLVQPRKVGTRSSAGFNPARREDIRLFQAVLRGEHHLWGFRNRDIRCVLFGDSSSPQARRRHSAAVGRKLKRLHVRGLIAKVPHARRWQVTVLGHQLLAAIVRLYYHGLANAA